MVTLAVTSRFLCSSRFSLSSNAFLELGDLKKNRVTLDVTSAWKLREALKVKGSVESQGKL